MQPSVFYLYNESSKTDAKLCQELETWLYTLQRDIRHTSRWHRTLPGHEWRVEQLQRMGEADLILLLLSPDFLSADDCHALSLTALRERQLGAIVIPLLLRPVASLKSLPLEHLQILPRNGIPLVRWRRRDDAWQHICDEIRAVLETASLRSANRPKLEPGTLVGHYRLIDKIASSANSDVYLAQHTILSRRAAIKVLARHREVGHVAEAVITEAEVMTIVAHPAVPAVYDVGRLSDGTPYIIMEFLRGQALSLSAFADSTQTPSWSTIFTTLARLAQALAQIHSRGYIHCDLKPDNIIIRREPNEGTNHFDAKIVDFGLARHVATAASVVRSERLLPIGTPAYIPPEQIYDSQPITAKADVYSFGAVLFELFAGCLPFSGANARDVMMARFSDSAPPLLSVLSHFYPPLASMIDSMLSTDPDSRPAMSAVANIFDQALQEDAALLMPPIEDRLPPVSQPCESGTSSNSDALTSTLEQ